VLGDDLEYFLAIVSTGTVTGAAQRLGVSQPALTKAVQRLERKVGVQLVTRTPRGVELTDAGRAFRDRLQRVSRDMDDALQEARDLGGGHAGLLRMGVTPATTDFALRALLPTLINERPLSRIHFTTAFGATLLDAVSRKDVELAVCPIPDKIDPALEHEVLYEEPCYLMFNSQHPLAARTSIDLDELARYPWAGTRKHEFARAMVERAFVARGLAPPSIVMEADNLQALILIVSRTHLISMINLGSIGAGTLPDNVMVRPLALEGVQRRIGIVRRAGYLSPIAQRAQEILRDGAQAFSNGLAT
jgi:DNA-binding transcriptional LysR family regulator